MLVESTFRIITLLIAFGAPAAVIIVIARLRYAQKMELIRRGIVTQDTLPRFPGNKSLFWGIILIGLGIALIASTIVNPSHEYLRFGFMMVGIGASLLVYWKVTGPERKRLIQLYEDRVRENY
ncbi:MAG: DUF6249 domain-containing protein [Candidatus Latescibacterota bacterium]